ncbi:MAG: geranylgeranyl diphosphate synthase type I, partial [Candidatus Thalassarchaeaceae archaeon]
AKWGLNLGLCFQLMDDLIDITGDTVTLGKPAGSDIVQGKMTLIAIHAMKSGLDLENFKKVFGHGSCHDTELLEAVKDLRKSGSIEYARKKAMHHHSIAHECLDKLIQSPQVDILRELTDYQLIRIN